MGLVTGHVWLVTTTDEDPSFGIYMGMAARNSSSSFPGRSAADLVPFVVDLILLCDKGVFDAGL